MTWSRFAGRILKDKATLRLRNPALTRCNLEADKDNTTMWNKEVTSATFQSIGIHDYECAKNFIERLLPCERELLRDIIERKQDEEEIVKQTKSVEDVHHDDLVKLWWLNYIPYGGFGFMDNSLMIIVGESFDRSIGLYVGISIMGAAALGNVASNVFGIGLVHYVERFLFKYFDLRTPALSVAQLNHWSVGFVTNLAKVSGIISGCILGMFPLLFYTSPERPVVLVSPEADENEAENADLELKENDFSKCDYLNTIARTLNPQIFEEYEDFRKHLSAKNDSFDDNYTVDEVDD